MLGDDIAAALPQLQAEAESTMTTPCTVKRPTGTTPDPATGADVTSYTPVWSGSGSPPEDPGCKLQSRDLAVRDAEVAEGTVITQQIEVQVPVSAGPFRVGDVVEAAGRTFRLSGLHSKTWQTAQRLPAEEVQS